jgi:hypothetical protein
LRQADDADQIGQAPPRRRPIDRRIASLPGVRDVMPIQVYTNNCRASLDVVVFYGTLPDQVRQLRDFTLLAGDWQELEQHQDSAIAGRAVAQRRDLKVGDKFAIGALDVVIAGIFYPLRIIPTDSDLEYRRFVVGRVPYNVPIGTPTSLPDSYHRAELHFQSAHFLTRSARTGFSCM